MVVKFPAAGVVVPIAPGAAHVLPIKLEALIVPVLEYVREAPAPTTIAAVVLVAEVIPENGTEDAETPDMVVHDIAPVLSIPLTVWVALHPPSKKLSPVAAAVS